MPCFYKRSLRSSGSRSPHCEHDTVKFTAFHIRATEPRHVIAGYRGLWSGRHGGDQRSSVRGI